MTGDEFERGYADASGLTVEWLRAQGRIVVRCDCGDDLCRGWASVPGDIARYWAEIEMANDLGSRAPVGCAVCGHAQTHFRTEGCLGYITVGGVRTPCRCPLYVKPIEMSC